MNRKHVASHAGDYPKQRIIYFPAVILQDRRICKNAIAVLSALSYFSDKDGYCYPRIKKIAELLDTSEATVRRGLRSLSSAGYIRVQSNYRTDGSSSSNSYFLRLDACEADIPTEYFRDLHSDKGGYQTPKDYPSHTEGGPITSDRAGYHSRKPMKDNNRKITEKDNIEGDSLSVSAGKNASGGNVENDLFATQLPAVHKPEKNGSIANMGNSLANSSSKSSNKRPQYTPEFLTFKNAYPWKRTMSTKAAFAEWQRLSGEDQQAALCGAEEYARECKNKDPQYWKHAERFLKQRLFDNYQDPATVAELSGNAAVLARFIDDRRDNYEH
ncbi:helix-turn-helix domain-containing protein [Pseudovibrio ascidiaceicola]|uniref:helix-turn-helix domain-containing protein n=1 Tax=Pseudovibrio ascidiaceicola TaxID=285279 RepID=UPI003D35F204